MPSKIVEDLISRVNKMELELRFNTWVTCIMLAAILGKAVIDYIRK